MRAGFWPVLTLQILLVAAGGGRARSEETNSGDLPLRETRGRVEELVVFRDAEGGEWQDLLIRSDGGPPLRVRLAPVPFLTESCFKLNPGDEVRVRYFSAGDPPPVQRIRNQSTGQMLRLRCLHGEGFWDARGHPGAGPHHRGGEGAPGPGGHGGPEPRRGP